MRSRPMRRYAGQRGRRQRKGRPRFTPLVSGLIRAGSRKDAACSNRCPFLTFPRCGRASQGLERRRFCDETKAKRKEARSIRESRLDPHMQPHFAADTMSDSRRTDFIPSDRLPTIGTRRQTQFAKRPHKRPPLAADALRPGGARRARLDLPALALFFCCLTRIFDRFQGGDFRVVEFAADLFDFADVDVLDDISSFRVD